MSKRIENLDARITAELRYWDPAKVAEDFPRPSQRKAIAAVFRWLNLHSVCAWKMGTTGTKYNCAIGRKRAMGKLDAVDALVIDNADVEAFEKALGIDR